MFKYCKFIKLVGEASLHEFSGNYNDNDNDNDNDNEIILFGHREKTVKC